MLKIILVPVVLVIILLIVLGCCFVTIAPTRQISFEEEIQNFAEQAEPGSEISLFNGEDLSGWEVHGLGQWSVKDGNLAVRRGVGYLATKCKEFDDFILTLEAKVNKEGNSGVYFRSKHPGFGFRPWPIGYEAQIDNHDPKNPTGSLYDRASAEMGLAKDNEWFTMKVEAIGSNMKIYVNDTLAVDTTHSEFEKGFIALQAHDFGSVLEFKNIRLRMPDKE